jgi:putative DNA primase/helicase
MLWGRPQSPKHERTSLRLCGEAGRSKCGLRKKIFYKPEDSHKRTEPMIGTLASEIKTQRVSGVWQQSFLPRSKVVIIEGDPGVGKSTISLGIAARLSTSSPWPDGCKAGPRPRGAVVITAEDGLADTIKPRLEALGGNLGLIRIVREVTDANGSLRRPSLPHDLAKMAPAITLVDASLLFWIRSLHSFP